MFPLIPLLIKLLLPVAVSEVQKKMNTDKGVRGSNDPDTTIAEAAVPALQQVVAGAVVSKTAWFSGLLLLVGFLEQNSSILSNLVPPQYMGLVIAGIGFISLLLRAMTGSSLVEKADSSSKD